MTDVISLETVGTATTVINQGTVGPQGAVGAQGFPGLDGAAGLFVVSVTESTTVAANSFLLADTSGTDAGATYTFPASPQTGWRVRVLDVGGSVDTKPITVAGNGHDVADGGETRTISEPYRGESFVFEGNLDSWRLEEKVFFSHIAATDNPHAVTKSQIGLGNVTNDTQVKRSEIGVPNGVATLGDDGIVPSSQLPVVDSGPWSSPIPATYLSASSFSASTDITAELSPGVRVQADCGADGLQYGTVASSSYADPTTTVVLDMDNGDALTSNLTGVRHGNDDRLSLVNHAAQHAPGGRDQLSPILPPAIVSPAAGSIVDTSTPTISGGPYRSLYGAPQAGLTVEIATDAAFANIVYTGSETGDSTTHTVAAGHIETSGTYYARLRYTDEDGNQSAWGEPVEFTTAASFAQIMGVALVTAGGGGGTWARINANGDTIVPATGYFDAHPVWGGVTDVTIDGQAMVKIPAFYVKRGTIPSGANAGKEAWWISDTLVDGFHLHPAFRDVGNNVDQFYIGKYQGSLNSAKLASLPGVAPAVSRSLTQFQADASARNVSGVVGFMLWSIHQWSAIQWLYLVEKATMDSQTATGQGRVNTTSAANVDAADVAQATYRGMVGLWGNVYQWMDGMKTGSNVISLWDANGNKAWVNTTRKRTAEAGRIYPTDFMSQSGTDYNFGDHFIGDAGPTTNSGATVPDGQYVSEANDYYPVVGARWDDATDAGLWFVNCNAEASITTTSVGARLAKV